EGRDRAAVRRERRERRGPRGRSEPLLRASRGGHSPEVARVVVVTLGVTGRGEHDRLAVRCPRGIRVDEIAVGQLDGYAPVEPDHEDVRPPVVDEPLTVEPVLHRGDDPGGPGLTLLRLALRLPLAADR